MEKRSSANAKFDPILVYTQGIEGDTEHLIHYLFPLSPSLSHSVVGWLGTMGK